VAKIHNITSITPEPNLLNKKNQFITIKKLENTHLFFNTKFIKHPIENWRFAGKTNNFSLKIAQCLPRTTRNVD
jgi:hypothetical protein